MVVLQNGQGHLSSVLRGGELKVKVLAGVVSPKLPSPALCVCVGGLVVQGPLSSDTWIRELFLYLHFASHLVEVKNVNVAQTRGLVYGCPIFVSSFEAKTSQSYCQQ